jgi:hypothetical protein
VDNIPIGRQVNRLHVLHASWQVTMDKYGSMDTPIWKTIVPDGTPVGHYVWHYADGQERETPIVYGRDLRDWIRLPGESDPPLPANSRAVLAWTGRSLAPLRKDVQLRLYRCTYENPRPDVEVVSIDLVSNVLRSAPLLVAMTVEP